jgi:hypothetical protein
MARNKSPSFMGLRKESHPSFFREVVPVFNRTYHANIVQEMYHRMGEAISLKFSITSLR